MAFFSNRTVNLLNLHFGVHSVAMSGGAAFYLIYLLKSGVPVPVILVSLALIFVGRFVLRPIVIGLAARNGLRAMVVAARCSARCNTRCSPRFTASARLWSP